MQTRDVGIDVTRAVALIGMFAAHLTYPDGVLAEVLYGFPSALFAFVAGVSMAFMSARGARPAHFVVRGVVLVAMFVALSLVPTDIEVVLGTLGVCMIATAWAPRWVAEVSPVPVLLLTAALTIVSGLFGGFTYSPFMWAVLMIAGMIFQRFVLGSRLVVAGAVVGLAVMALDIAARWYADVSWFWDVDGHTGGVLDVVGSVGASIGMCSLCCLLARPCQVVLPRMGRMPLTPYCLHVLSAAFIGFWVTLAGAALLAVGWLTFFPRGPVEEGVRRCVRAGARKLSNERNEGNHNESNNAEIDGVVAGRRFDNRSAGVGDAERILRR